MTRKCLMILLCMPLAFLVGCFDYRDVEDLSVPVVVAYDAPQKSDYQETEKVVISGAIVNPTPGMPQNRIERIVARTTADARTKPLITLRDFWSWGKSRFFFMVKIWPAKDWILMMGFKGSPDQTHFIYGYCRRTSR